MLHKKLLLGGKLCSYYCSSNFSKDRPTWLFLHGWGDSARSFSGLYDQCNQDGIQWLAVDFPGFGSSQALHEGANVDDYLSRLCHFLQKIKVQDVSLLIGHSFGCRVMLKGFFSKTLPAKSCVMIGAGGIQEKNDLRYYPFLKIGKKVLTFVGAQSLLTFFQDKFRSEDYKAAGGLEKTFLEVISEDLQYTFGSVTIPTLLIWGKQDDQTPLSHGLVFHEGIPQSKLEVFDGGTHFVHQEFSKDIYTLIRSYG